MQPWCSAFPILNLSFVPCPVIIVASWPAYRFLRRQVRWSDSLISFRIFQFVVLHTVKGFSVINEAEVDVLLEFSCFFCDSTDVVNLISGSSAFSKIDLEHLEVLVHVLLKPSLENIEHCFASMWDEWDCAVVWTFFGITCLWDWNEIPHKRLQERTVQLSPIKLQNHERYCSCFIPQSFGVVVTQ